MNEPIVSPWLFYTFQVCDGLRFACVSVLVVSAFTMVLSGLMYYLDPPGGKEASGRLKAVLKASALATAISCSAAIFIPSKDTLLQMTAAYYVTPSSIDAAQGKAVDFAEEIAKAIARGIAESQDGNGGWKQ